MSSYDKALERARAEFPHVRQQVKDELATRTAYKRWKPKRPVVIPSIKDVLKEMGLL